MNIKSIFKLFLGGLDSDLSSVQTSSLVECARETTAKIRELESAAGADVESIEPMKDRLARVVAEIKRRDYWRKLLSGSPLPSAEQINVIAAETCLSIPAPVRERLAELVEAWNRDTAEMLKFTPAQATKDFQEHEAKLTELAASGGNVASHESWTRDEWYDDYRNKLNALRSAQMRHTTEARQLVAPYVEQFQTEVAEVAAVKETNERDAAARYKLAFEPSAVLRLLKRTQLALQDGEIPNGSSPAEFAAFIVN